MGINGMYATINGHIGGLVSRLTVDGDKDCEITGEVVINHIGVIFRRDKLGVAV